MVFLLDSIPYTAYGHFAAVGALAWGSHHALRRWIAVSSLVPPTVAPSELQPDPKKKRKEAFKALSIILSIFAVEFFAIWKMTHLKDQKSLDICWSVFEFICMIFPTHAAIPVIFNAQLRVRCIKNTDPSAKFNLSQIISGPNFVRFFLASLISAAVVFTSSMGSVVLHPIMAGIWVMGLIANQQYPKITVRMVTLVLNGYLYVVTPVISLLIVGGTALVFKIFNIQDTPSSEPSEPTAEPSAWVLRLMMLIGMAMPTAITGILVALALRFDHSRFDSAIKLPPAGPGESVDVPKSLPSFPKPMFVTGVLSLGATLTCLQLVAMRVDPDMFSGMIWMFVTVPVVSLALIARAYSLGMLKDWWKYEEQWVPKLEPTAVSAENVENGEEQMSEVKNEKEKLVILAQ